MLVLKDTLLAVLFVLPGAFAARNGISKDFAIVPVAKREFINGPDRRSEAHVKDTEMFGEEHGEAFDDAYYAKNGHARISEVRFAGCGSGEHLGSMQSTFVQVSPGYIGLPVTVVHGQGTKVKTPSTFTLGENEYFQSIDITTYRQKTGYFHTVRRTRIGSITLTTNKLKSVTCGDKSRGDPSRHWEFKEHALLYFSGSSGDAIDALKAHFIPVQDYWF